MLDKLQRQLPVLLEFIVGLQRSGEHWVRPASEPVKHALLIEGCGHAGRQDDSDRRVWKRVRRPACAHQSDRVTLAPRILRLTLEETIEEGAHRWPNIYFGGVPGGFFFHGISRGARGARAGGGWGRAICSSGSASAPGAGGAMFSRQPAMRAWRP